MPRLPQVRIAFRATLALALLVMIGTQTSCGGSDEGSSNPQIRQVEIESLAAYACMPEAKRRELRALERRHDARVRELARRIPKAGVTGPTFRQTVQSDPTRLRLLAKARAIYRQYLPGGSGYDASCFFREREKAKTRLEKGR
jgi:hypothetical protein